MIKSVEMLYAVKIMSDIIKVVKVRNRKGDGRNARW